MVANSESVAPEQVGRLYPIAKAIMTPTFRALWKLRVVGLENVPPSGPAIFCPNHVSVLDSFFLPAVLPRKITYVGKAEYMDDWKTKRLFPALGMIPIDRSGGDSAQAALDVAASVLERGEFFGIYPEGTRSRDGQLHKGHTGPARLALRTGSPLIPVGLRGTLDVMPPDAKFPKLRKAVTIRIGRPIPVERFADRASDRLVLRQIIDEVMFEVRELSGQEYVDEYSGKATPKPKPKPEVGVEHGPSPDDAEQEPSAPERERVLAGVANGHADAPAGRTDVVEASVGATPRSSVDVLRRRAEAANSR